MRVLAELALGAGLVATLLLSPRAGVAQEPGVRAYLDPGSTVGVGRPFVLNLEVTGSQQLTQEPELPDLGSFAQFLGRSSQSSMQVVNGRASVSVTVQYRYQALEEGTFEIPSFEVQAGGRMHSTEPLDITVSTSPPPSNPGGGTQAGGIADEDLFVTAEATRARVRDGEPFMVEYRIWTRVDVSSFNFTRLPEPEGFWVEDITPAGQPGVEQLTRDGRQYTTAVIRRIALVPTGPGTRTLEPVGLEVQVRVRRSDPFDFFGRSPLFGRSTVPTAVLSNPLTLDVEPLPPGRPEPFSGVVGQLAVTTELGRDSVGTNEAVTLTVRVDGSGNIRAVPEPTLALPPDFEVFPPEVSERVQPFGAGLSGEKTFEYVMIPRAPGRRDLGAVSLGFFDAEAGEYRVAESAPLSLTVTGTVVDGSGGLARGGVAQLREDIRFIHLGAGTLRPRDRMPFGQPGFWIFALLPLVAIVGAVGLRRHRDLLEGDVAYARGRSAGRTARKRLAQARRLAGEDDSRAFYAEVARALRGLVADRLNLAEAGLQTHELERWLSETGVGAETIEEVRACLDLCDHQRFAPPAADPQEKSRFLERVGTLMGALDRAIRR